MKYPLLKEIDSRFATKPLIIQCRRCQTTMWCNSDNAHVVENKDIVCADCLTEDER